MTKRQRLEDLGKLSVMLRNITNQDIFTFADSKHGFESWKKSCYDREEYGEPRGLESIFDDIRTLNRELQECLTIAEGYEDDD